MLCETDITTLMVYIYMCIHTHTHTHTHTVDYYAAITKKEILLFVTIWMDLEGIMLSEISQTEKDKYCIISFVESKKTKLIETVGRLVVSRGWGVGGRWGN